MIQQLISLRSIGVQSATVLVTALVASVAARSRAARDTPSEPPNAGRTGREDRGSGNLPAATNRRRLAAAVLNFSRSKLFYNARNFNAAPGRVAHGRNSETAKDIEACA
jgi:hypothetical protein